jgi:metallophosphoesterase superfamily enzyme
MRAAGLLSRLPTRRSAIRVETKEANAMRKIYVSDSGNDKDDGLSAKTPIRSWQRFIQLCEGHDEIIIMGNADTGKMRLIAEIDKKGRVAQGEVVPKAS